MATKESLQRLLGLKTVYKKIAVSSDQTLKFTATQESQENMLGEAFNVIHVESMTFFP